MPETPAAFTAGQRATAGLLTLDLMGEYRDELACPGFAETMPRWAATNNNIISSGNVYLMPVYLAAGQVVSNFTWVNGGTAGATLTHQWAVLLNSAYAQLAITADKTSTAIPATTAFSWGVATIASGAASSFTATYSGLHFVGLMIAGTTTPTPIGSTQINGINGIAPSFGLADTAQTTPPAFPHTDATPTSHTSPYHWMYLS